MVPLVALRRRVLRRVRVRVVDPFFGFEVPATDCVRFQPPTYRTIRTSSMGKNPSLVSPPRGCPRNMIIVAVERRDVACRRGYRMESSSVQEGDIHPLAGSVRPVNCWSARGGEVSVDREFLV